MSRFNQIVPVPLGEIRCLDGKLTAQTLPGCLVTAIGAFGGGDSNHYQPDYPNATFTLNGAGNAAGVMIVMEQEDLVTQAISTAFASGSHARAHVLKSGEEVTVILTAAAVIAAGDKLAPAANGKVVKVTGEQGEADPMFVAIETATAESTGDGLRILARVL